MLFRCILVCALLAPLACDNKDSTPAPASGASAADDLGAMTEYMRKSKSAEAKVNLGAIARGIVSASQQEYVGPDGTLRPFVLAPAPLTPPSGVCCKLPKGRCAADSGDWKHPAWRAIFFELGDPHYYSYQVAVDATGFVARAVGDLDCDGSLATFELRGTLAAGGAYEIATEPTSAAPLE